VITDVPGATPLTKPELLPTVAVAVLLLLHTPPVTASLNAVVRPWHTVAVPVIAATPGLTVTVALVRQPVVNV